MRPCVGVDGICPPLAAYRELTDGTYSLADVERFNQAIDELISAKSSALATAKKR